MRYLVLVASLGLMACAPDKEIVSVIKGDPGQDGINGTSCSAYQTEGGAVLLCANGEEVFVSNGAPGPQGPQGIPGIDGEDGEAGEDGQPGEDGSAASVTLLDYSANSCTKILDTDAYVKKNGSNYRLYSHSSCHSSTLFAEVSQGEAYWVSATALATHADSKLRVIYFGGE